MSTKTLKDVFSGEKPIHGGSLLVFFIFSIWFVFSPKINTLPPVAGIVVPMGILFVAETVIRFGDWIEYRVRGRR